MGQAAELCVMCVNVKYGFHPTQRTYTQRKALV